MFLLEIWGFSWDQCPTFGLKMSDYLDIGTEIMITHTYGVFSSFFFQFKPKGRPILLHTLSFHLIFFPQLSVNCFNGIQAIMTPRPAECLRLFIP